MTKDVPPSPPKKKAVKAAHVAGCPLRESMIHFVGNLRSLDSWKKEEEQLAPQVAQLEMTNSPFVKSPVCRSSDVPQLLEFMAESVVQMNFLIRLPSIELCLAEWWRAISHGAALMTPSMTFQMVALTPPCQLTAMYSGLASVLLEARTPNLQQSGVKILMRCKWCKWDKWVAAADPPLTEMDMHQLIFQLGYLCVPSDLLHDYVAFFQSTLRKLTTHVDKHGGASKASISERRLSRLQHMESRDATKNRPSQCIVLHPATSAQHGEHDGTDDGVGGTLRRSTSSAVIPKMTPMTVTQFRHVRTKPLSSQVLVADLGLLLPQFQNKFHVVDAMAAACRPLEYAPPMRIDPVPWMNPKIHSTTHSMGKRTDRTMSTAPLLLQPATTLDDIERLVTQCTRTMHQNSLREHPATNTWAKQRDKDDDLLRRSMSHPLLRQRRQLRN